MAEIYFYNAKELPKDGFVLPVDDKLLDEISELVEGVGVEDVHGYTAAPGFMIGLELEELLGELDVCEDDAVDLLCCDLFTTSAQIENGRN